MKTRKPYTPENSLEVSDFAVLTNNEMNTLRGGVVKIKPKSRDKDVFDFEEE